jgi:hypothetical protein
VVVEGGSVSGNVSEGGAGVYMGSGSLQWSGGTISMNTSSYRGGGLYLQGGNASLAGVTVSGNTSAGDGGGLWSSVGVTLTACVVEANDAGGYGGAWYKSSNTWDAGGWDAVLWEWREHQRQLHRSGGE